MGIGHATVPVPDYSPNVWRRMAAEKSNRRSSGQGVMMEGALRLLSESLQAELCAKAQKLRMGD